MIVPESAQNLEPKTAYVCYEDLWLLELVFNRNKSDECLDHTDVQNDFSVIGNEFINFISTVATCRIIRKERGRKPKAKNQTEQKLKRPCGRP